MKVFVCFQNKTGSALQDGIRAYATATRTLRWRGCITCGPTAKTLEAACQIQSWLVGTNCPLWSLSSFICVRHQKASHISFLFWEFVYCTFITTQKSWSPTSMVGQILTELRSPSWSKFDQVPESIYQWFFLLASLQQESSTWNLNCQKQRQLPSWQAGTQTGKTVQTKRRGLEDE